MGSLLEQLPWDSATVRSIHGDIAIWGSVEHLLAMAVDALRMANWQRSGEKKIPRPEPIPRPGSTAHRPRLSQAQTSARLRDLQRRSARRRAQKEG